ncbi:MAG: histidine triad nucleotide-binding protein [Bdellovibrionales bacterium]|nr:histidine triad nucleotide-binding protein [Bdellovibrionales bacterium]
MSNQDTIFHKIIRKEIPADIVFEDDEVLAFRDIQPVSPTHILVIPKKTLPSLREASDEDTALLGRLLRTCSQIAKDLGLDADGYRVVVNAGEGAGQSVFQLHLHLLAGRSFSWPPG